MTGSDEAHDVGATVALLEQSRDREKRQALFYRRLAALAEEAGEARDGERLNELHADEQHHLSRLTARVLELGADPVDLSSLESPTSMLEGWEAEARPREIEEVGWYESLLTEKLDDATRLVLEEILASERHHREELGGKWMPA